jgi:histidyl-tRNA synthetase
LTRLFAKLKEAGLLQPPARTPAEVLITTMEGQDPGSYWSMARTLRDAGINTEVYLEPARLKNQLAYAEKKGFRIALIAGETEFANRVVQVKNLAARTAQDCSVEKLVSTVKHILKQPPSLKGN